MNYRLSSGLILFVIILVNALGYFLRYLELNTYFIFLGFRFHISLFLPFILIISKEMRAAVRRVFLDPGYKGKFLPLVWILIPVLILSVSPFLTKVIKQGDPEYFYEFGLSSVFDYPVYLLWNLPQLILFYFFLVSASSGRKNKFFLLLLFNFFLFIFELLPLNFNTEPALNYSALGALFLSAVIAAMLISFFENIYWFSAALFTVLWSCFLAFGSSSVTIVNIFFASRYRSWEGFLAGEKGLDSYLILIYLFLVILLIFITLPFRKRFPAKIHSVEAKNISQIPGIG